MNFKYNEIIYGETIYNNGFQTEYINSEMTILVKYLKLVKEFKKKQTVEFMYAFCEKHIEGYNEVKYFKAIDRAILKGRKKDNKLIVIEKVSIYRKEIEEIDKLDIGHEHKKLLFAFLVSKKISLEIKKIYNEGTNEMSIYYGGDKRKYSALFRTANVVGKYKIEDMIYELINKDVLESVINGGILLKYIYPIYDTRKETYQTKNKDTSELEDKEKDIVVCNVDGFEVYEDIQDYDNVGYIFDYYKGENKIKKCECCGIYMKQKSNKNKYCEVCSEKIERENHKERNKKWYKNKIRTK